MNINFQGEEFTLELEDLTVAQAKVIKIHTGLTLIGLEQGLGEGDPDALRALYWLMHAQSGKPCNIDDADFKIVAFSQALEAALPKDGESGEGPKDSAAT